MRTEITRRRFGALAGGALGSFALGACRVDSAPFAGGDGRITARLRTGDTPPGGIASGPLGLENGRDAILQLPPSGAGAAPLPLLVLLHGATGRADGIMRRIGSAPGDAGVAVLAPDSRGGTWDAIRGGFGADVDYLNRALQRVFDTIAIDPARVAIGGFSDGATYALSLGLINGDLFRRVVAFSPGFVVPGETHGKAAFFVSHGTADTILPIEECSRVIVPALRRRGYEVTFREFNGPHTVPPDIAADAMKWLAS
jgi:phospholipase/carboxylesterase